ncbi:membrane protein [Staphylococcus aureus]|nr:membrane protein [Staphylococcus aureus]
MDLNLTMIIIIILFGFIAAFIDSVVGGGGLISTPALLAIGLPPSVALGTNKLASSFGSLTSTIKFIRSGKVDLFVVAKLFGFVFLASACGAYIATMVPSQILKPLIIIALSSVFIFTLLKKDWGNTRTFTQFTFKKAIIFAALFILIGFYDGFVGGGTGSFMLFVLLIFGFDFLSAAGNAKVLNFASNIGALVLFMVFRTSRLCNRFNYGYKHDCWVIYWSTFCYQTRCCLCKSIIYYYYCYFNFKKCF